MIAFTALLLSLLFHRRLARRVHGQALERPSALLFRSNMVYIEES